jgi:hypothetical protein
MVVVGALVVVVVVVVMVVVVVVVVVVVFVGCVFGFGVQDGQIGQHQHGLHGRLQQGRDVLSVVTGVVVGRVVVGSVCVVDDLVVGGGVEVVTVLGGATDVFDQQGHGHPQGMQIRGVLQMQILHLYEGTHCSSRGTTGPGGLPKQNPSCSGFISRLQTAPTNEAKTNKFGNIFFASFMFTGTRFQVSITSTKKS